MELDASFVSDLMESDGPVVRCVFVRADSGLAEIELDMTPKGAPSAILGGTPTFAGTISSPMSPSWSLQTLPETLEQACFPPPMDQREIVAPSLIRMDENSEPRTFAEQSIGKTQATSRG